MQASLARPLSMIRILVTGCFLAGLVGATAPGAALAGGAQSSPAPAAAAEPLAIWWVVAAGGKLYLPAMDLSPQRAGPPRLIQAAGPTVLEAKVKPPVPPAKDDVVVYRGGKVLCRVRPGPVVLLGRVELGVWDAEAFGLNRGPKRRPRLSQKRRMKLWRKATVGAFRRLDGCPVSRGAGALWAAPATVQPRPWKRTTTLEGPAKAAVEEIRRGLAADGIDAAAVQGAPDPLEVTAWVSGDGRAVLRVLAGWAGIEEESGGAPLEPFGWGLWYVDSGVLHPLREVGQSGWLVSVGAAGDLDGDGQVEVILEEDPITGHTTINRLTQSAGGGYVLKKLAEDRYHGEGEML